MEGWLIRKREKLTDYRDDYVECGTCGMCQPIDVRDIGSGRFSAKCPTGTFHRSESYCASGMLEIARALADNEFEPTDKTAEIIYSCNLCGHCQEVCGPLKGLYPTRVIQLLREKAVDEGWGPLPAHAPIIESIRENENPFGLSRGFKSRAAAGLGCKDLTREKADTLFFVGCALVADPEVVKKLGPTARLLEAAGLDYGVLGDEEPCCRSMSLALGDRDRFEENALLSIKKFKATGAKRIVTGCAHCYQVFTDEYSRVMDIPVMHTTQLAALAIREGKIKPRKEVALRVAYHDPCMLGRWCGVYDEPREALGALPGLVLVEFERNRENSWCCGAGGGVNAADPELARWTVKERIEEARTVGAEGIVTACPHCETQFVRAGANLYGVNELVDLSF